MCWLLLIVGMSCRINILVGIISKIMELLIYGIIKNNRLNYGVLSEMGGVEINNTMLG